MVLEKISRSHSFPESINGLMTKYFDGTGLLQKTNSGSTRFSLSHTLFPQESLLKELEVIVVYRCKPRKHKGKMVSWDMLI